MTLSALVRIFLLDDHEAVRSAVRSPLDTEPGITVTGEAGTVTGEAGTAAAALAVIPALRPDVAVLDVRLPDGDGVAVCRELRSRMPALARAPLTAHDDSEALFATAMAGVGENTFDPSLGCGHLHIRVGAHPPVLAGWSVGRRQATTIWQYGSSYGQKVG